MTRYGWRLGREQDSPYSSFLGEPTVTDDDYSYITSQDLDDVAVSSLDNRYESPEDDVLIIKNKGVTYPIHFPAYSIGDGKLHVKDVKERVGLIMELTNQATGRLSLIYKGRQMRELAAPIRDYGVKNKSELMAVFPDTETEAYASDEELVVVADKTLHRNKSRKRRDAGNGGFASSSSYPQSNSPARSSSPRQLDSSQLTLIEELSKEFNAKWLPLCERYIAAPPTDAKTREEEHLRLTETLMTNVLLKLDGVETDGVALIRTKRKEIVDRVQQCLKELDAVKAR